MPSPWGRGPPVWPLQDRSPPGSGPSRDPPPSRRRWPAPRSRRGHRPLPRPRLRRPESPLVKVTGPSRPEGRRSPPCSRARRSCSTSPVGPPSGRRRSSCRRSELPASTRGSSDSSHRRPSTTTRSTTSSADSRTSIEAPGTSGPWAASATRCSTTCVWPRSFGPPGAHVSCRRSWSTSGTITSPLRPPRHPSSGTCTPSIATPSGPTLLGRFTDLLQAVTRSSAMVEYLDTRASSAPDVNENHGRELLELHTVGRDAGFGPTDVIGAARVLSGWTLDPRTLSVTFDPDRHHSGPATVLGWSTPGHAGAAGAGDLDGMLGHLATHPATATRVASLLVERFVADEAPPELVASTASAYLAAGTDLAATLRHLFASTPFRSTSAPITRRPFDLFAAQLRAADADLDVPNLVERLLPVTTELEPLVGPLLDATGVVDPLAEPLARWALDRRPIATSVVQVLRANGQPLFAAPNPAGHPMAGASWTSGDASAPSLDARRPAGPGRPRWHHHRSGRTRRWCHHRRRRRRRAGPAVLRGGTCRRAPGPPPSPPWGWRATSRSLHHSSGWPCRSCSPPRRCRSDDRHDPLSAPLPRRHRGDLHGRGDDSPRPTTAGLRGRRGRHPHARAGPAGGWARRAQRARPSGGRRLRAAPEQHSHPRGPGDRRRRDVRPPPRPGPHRRAVDRWTGRRRAGRGHPHREPEPLRRDVGCRPGHGRRGG